MSDQERKQDEVDPEEMEEAPTLVRAPAAGATEPGDADTWLSSSASRPIDASSLAPGCTVAGRYTVLDWLGQGGMGVVLAAYDARLDRRVALKLLRYREDEQATGGSASNSLEARLVREAQAMARLSHPHVVAVYDAGTLEDGSLFIAMEYVEGQTLREWCAQQARSWREVLGAYLSAGRGLAAAHEAGLIHRDFKPDNVLVGQDGRVRVTDFGLARVGTDAAEPAPVPEEPSPRPLPSGPWSSGSARTVAGSLLGTPGYMALEQLQRRPADARSDLFAFCSSLYEALYGHLPFSGDTLGELARAQQEERVAPLSPASEVPAWVARVVLRGLRADPSRRPASMEVLLAALEDDPEVKRKARLRTAALVGGVAVLTGLAAWGLVRQQGSGCGDMESRLVGVWDAPVKEQVRRALEDTGLPYARDTAERVSAVLDGYASAWVRQRTEVCEVGRGGAARSGSLALLQEYCLERRRSQLRALTELLARGADRELVDRAVQAAQSLPPLAYCADAKALTAAVPLPEEPAVRARVESLQERVDRLQALHDAGKFREGLSLGDSLRDEVEQSGYAPLQANTLLLVARLREGAGDFKGAEAVTRQAIVQAARGKDLVLLARAWSLLDFLVGYRQARHSEAQVLEPMVEAAAEVADESPTRADTLHVLSVVLGSMGRYEEAREREERALALREEVLGPEHFDVTISLNNLGNMLLKLGQYEEARAHFERALALREKALGPEHPDVATPLNNLGAVLTRLKRYDEARERYERALAVQEKALGPEHPSVASSLNNLGAALFYLGQHGEARERYERALVVQEKALGSEHPDVAATLSNLGNVLEKLGRYEEARARYERALALREKALGPKHPSLTGLLLRLGELLVERGRSLDALPRLESALSLSDDSERADVRFALARALWDSGKNRPLARKLATESQEYWQRLNYKSKLSRVSGWLVAHPDP